jgi:ankyrin repeat protein
VDVGGWTPLFHAAHAGTTEALKLLVQAGADVNHGKETGFTALFAAVMAGHVDAVRILLEAGAEIVPVHGIGLRGHAIRVRLQLEINKMRNSPREGQMDEILDKLQRIQQLWKKQEQVKLGTPEHEALMQQIRVLSAEYQALIDTPKKPRKSK